MRNETKQVWVERLSLRKETLELFRYPGLNDKEANAARCECWSQILEMVAAGIDPRAMKAVLPIAQRLLTYLQDGRDANQSEDVKTLVTLLKPVALNKE